MISIIASVLFVFSCSEDEDKAVGFETTSVTKQESDSTFSVRIYLGKVTSPTTVTVDVYGTAAVDGDYSFIASTTSSSSSSDIVLISDSTSSTSQRVVTALSGQSYVDLSFKLIDDPFVEPRAETIYLQITGISNETIEASLVNMDYQFIITDNDSPPEDAMQVDLSWRLGDGVSTTLGNFDMYLVKNVTISNNEVTSKELVDGVSSANAKGFESMLLEDSVPDDKYYVMVHYTSGAYDADIEMIFSKGTAYSRTTARISAIYVGDDFYVGPITKSGSSYSRVASEEPIAVYRGN